MKAILFLIIALATLMPHHADAQNSGGAIVIRGRLTDKNQHPLANVSVMEVDKDQRVIGGSATDQQGNFVLRISSTRNRISFSYIGYKTTTVEIGSRRQINIELSPGEDQLSEVIISSRKTVNNGTGLNVDDLNRTISVASINAKELEEMPSSSIDQALQGRLPGVDIAASSGDPGTGMQIRIRGTSSINAGTDPLIVVDGMPYETTVPDGFNFATADEQGYAQLLNIAPSDIRDISVLKDAAATAVWGARASNGVLIINTKRGTTGKPSVTYTFKGTASKQPRALPMLNGGQYSTLIPEAYMNATGRPLNTASMKEFLYDPRDPYWYYNYSNNTDWIDAITQTGYLQDHNISISGGGERAKYFASFGYFNQEGTTKGTDLNRITTRINLDYTVSALLSFRTDISYTHISNHQLYSNKVRNVAYRKMPNMSIYEYDINGNLTPNYFSPLSNIQGYYNGNASNSTYNPLAMADAAKNHQRGDRITPHFSIQYKIIPQVLTMTSDIQFDINTSKINTFLPQIATGRPFTETVVNRATDADYDAYNVQSKTNLLFTPRPGPKHSFQGLLSLQTNDYRYVDQQLMTSNTASSFMQDPSAPSRTQNEELSVSAANTRTRSVGLLVSGQYSFLDRYIINAGLRADGNSRFGPAHRYGLFPSLSGRWRVSGESFISRAHFINDLSIRASYGQSGNAPKTDYAYFNTYGTFGWTYTGFSGVYSQNMELKNLKWETIEGQNLGVDISLFKNRLSGSFDIYRNRTKDMIFPGLQLMSTTGYDAVDMNVGVMDNQGWEVNMNIVALKKKDWQLSFNINLAHNENMIRSISPLYPIESSKSTTLNGVYKSYLQTDNPFGSFYGYRFKGVYKDKAATVAADANGKPIVGLNGEQVYMRFNYPSTDYIFQPGDAQYEDINHDGNIDYRDIVYLGNGNPKLTGGFGPTISWKGNWRLTAFFSFRTGYQIINATKMYTTNMYGYDNQSTAVLRRWRNEGDVTDMPRAIYNAGYNWLGSDRYVENGSFLRWRTLTVRYNLPDKALKKTGFKALSFYVTGENILTFTRYTGQDPEVTTRITSPFSTTVDESMTPPVRNFTIGISATL
ncbi:SusC/RagA family TonB-linked outer membrane protein [Filimonas effusa]|uniref:SusC/RagA family TonB-linked outer membrane protein n=1 Tax=Filimonas effusa TaxID=2508721 RepID=A0A4Q1DBW1_9BACT|nr:SusC/RagA family TonB-linked outer membrane protein [Filimonas effusa]RXK86285.1 SusC/RagA family TonB-linked outer membrane protein [Filimonas effusa]